VTVGIVGNLAPPVAWRIPEDEAAPRIHRGLRFFPPLEIELGDHAQDEGGVYSYRAKVELADKLNYICPAWLDPDQVEELNWLAAATFRVTGCLDVARVDFRLDEAEGDKPYILEINPLPGLNPTVSDLCIMAGAEGMRYTDLINEILYLAAERYAQEAEAWNDR
jgi:D-alanine-D-alanine ligase